MKKKMDKQLNIITILILIWVVCISLILIINFWLNPYENPNYNSHENPFKDYNKNKNYWNCEKLNITSNENYTLPKNFDYIIGDIPNEQKIKNKIVIPKEEFFVISLNSSTPSVCEITKIENTMFFADPIKCNPKYETKENIDYVYTWVNQKEETIMVGGTQIICCWEEYCSTIYDFNDLPRFIEGSCTCKKGWVRPIIKGRRDNCLTCLSPDFETRKFFNEYDYPYWIG